MDSQEMQENRDCEICLKPSSYWSVESDEGGFYIQCKECQEALCNEEDLESHDKNHDGLSEIQADNQHKELIKCLRCDKSFTEQGHLEIHKWVHPQEEFVETPLQTTTSEKNEGLDANSTDTIPEIQKDPRSIVELDVIQNNLDKTDSEESTKHSIPNDPVTLEIYNNLDEETSSNSDSVNKKIVSLIEEDKNGNFGCRICRYKGNDNMPNMIIHAKTHIDSSMYPCKLCGRIFESTHSLGIHIYWSHKNHVGSDQCGHCQSFVNPLKSKNFLKCSACDTIFCKKDELTIHEKEHFIKCGGCDLNFINNVEMKKHESQHTNEYKCNDCDKIYKLKSRLLSHQLRHRDNRKYICNQCEANFTNIGYYNRHMWLHDGKRLYKCKVCGRSNFLRKHKFINHIQRHNNETPYPCNNCHKFLFTIRQLHNHRLIVHNDKTKYKPKNCKKCEKVFVETDQLTSHMVTHSMDRPFKCDYCTKSYQNAKALRYHTSNHSGENNFLCPICKKAVHKYKLSYHMQKHGERTFQCEQCSKSFHFQKLLQRHIRITHLKEKRFNCQTCDKGFFTSTDLKKHTRSKCFLKPYKCLNCDRMFSTKFTLKVHLKTTCKFFTDEKFEIKVNNLEEGEIIEAGDFLLKSR